MKNRKVANSLITSQASRWFINEAMHYPQGERNAISVLLSAQKFLFKEKYMHSMRHVRKLILMLTMS